MTVVETIERAKGEAEVLRTTLLELMALDAAQVMAARYELQDMQEWLHGLWMDALGQDAIRQAQGADEGER